MGVAVLKRRSQTKPTQAVIDAGHPLARGIVGCWMMLTPTGLALPDLSGYGNHGAIGGTAVPTWTVTPFGYGLTFNGASGFVDCGSNPILDDLSQWTVAMRIRPVDSGEGFFGRILDKSGGSGFRRIGTTDGTNHEIRVDVEEGGSTYLATPVTTWLENRWDYVVTVNDITGAVNRTYLNGVAQTALTGLGAGGVTTEAAGNLFIGNNSGQTNTFNGVISELIHWNRLLTPSEALWLQSEPYAFLRPDVRRTLVFYKAAAAGGTTRGPVFQFTTMGVT
jgi:hypothetical protein